MSARDELLDEYGRADTAPLGTFPELRAKLAAVHAEVLREAAEVSAQWNSDCQTCAVELEVAGKLRRMADEVGKVTPTGGEITRAELPPLWVADYDSAPLTLHWTREAARAACDDVAKVDARGRCWDWRTEEDGVDRQFWTHPDDDRPTGYTGGAVWEITVERDEAGKDTPGTGGESTRPAVQQPPHIGRGHAARFCLACQQTADERRGDPAARPVVVCPGDEEDGGAKPVAEPATGETHPGELATLRGLLGVVRVIAQHGDIEELRRVVAEYDTDESAAYNEGADE